MSFDGVNDYLRLKGVTENLTANTDLALNNASYIAAQKIQQYTVMFLYSVVLKLKLVGSLPSATLVVEIRYDSDGVPGSVVATSGSIACSGLSTSYYRYIPFIFSTPLTIARNLRYWISLRYNTTTGVDESNYVIWQYDNAGAYGEPRALYDGVTWTVTSGQSHYFVAYDNTLYFDGDLSVIWGMRPTLDNAWRSVFALGRSSLGNYYDNAEVDGNGFLYLRNWATVSSENHYVTQNKFSVNALTFSKTTSTGKMKSYLNGRLCKTLDGIADSAYSYAGEVVIGCRFSNTVDAGLLNYFKGLLGPFIVVKAVLTDAQIGEITNQMNVLRRLGVAL